MLSMDACMALSAKPHVVLERRSGSRGQWQAPALHSTGYAAHVTAHTNMHRRKGSTPASLRATRQTLHDRSTIVGVAIVGIRRNNDDVDLRSAVVLLVAHVHGMLFVPPGCI